MYQEDDDDYEGRSEFEEWFDDYRYFFPKELREKGEDNLEIFSFYSNTYQKIMNELAPAVRQLAYKQYPILKRETRPKILERINRRIEYVGHEFLLRLFDLFYDQKTGVNLHEKYPDFDKWVDFYAKPQKPHTMDESVFNNMDWLTTEQKQKMIDEADKELSDKFYFRENRKNEFIDMLQPIILKHYRELDNLDPDSWIIYSVWIREEHTDFMLAFEYFYSFILYEFDEEDINLKYNDFNKKYEEKYKEFIDTRPDITKHRLTDD